MRNVNQFHLIFYFQFYSFLFLLHFKKKMLHIIFEWLINIVIGLNRERILRIFLCILNFALHRFQGSLNFGPHFKQSLYRSYFQNSTRKIHNTFLNDASRICDKKDRNKDRSLKVSIIRKKKRKKID